MPEQIKRYHRSFIGLMEQSTEGEWVHSKDFEAALQAKEAEAEAMRSFSNSLIEKWHGLYHKEVTHNNKIFNQLQQANKIVFMYRCVMLFVLVIDAIGAYHG